MGLAACSSPGPASGQPPAWVSRPSESPAGTLAAAGAGTTRAEAIDAAMARLAQSIRVRVDAVEVAASSGTTQTGSHHGVTGTGRASTASLVRLSSAVDLPGVRVAQVWRDRAAGVFHARVTLDRASASRALADEADRALDEAARALTRPADGALARLRTARRADRAVERARAALDTRRAIVGDDAPRRRRLDELTRRADRALADARRAVTFAVRADTDADLAHDLEAGLIARGAVLDPRDPALVLVVERRAEPAVAFRPDLRLTRWEAHVAVVDARSRAVVARWQASGVAHGPAPGRPDGLDGWLDELLGPSPPARR